MAPLGLFPGAVPERPQPLLVARLVSKLCWGVQAVAGLSAWLQLNHWRSCAWQFGLLLWHMRKGNCREEKAGLAFKSVSSTRPLGSSHSACVRHTPCDGKGSLGVRQDRKPGTPENSLELAGSIGRQWHVTPSKDMHQLRCCSLA